MSKCQSFWWRTRSSRLSISFAPPFQAPIYAFPPQYTANAILLANLISSFPTLLAFFAQCKLFDSNEICNRFLVVYFKMP